MKAKRLISLLISVAMIISFIPVYTASATNDGYTYFFSKAAFGSDSNIARASLAAMTYESLDSSVTDSWKVAGSRYLYNAQSNNNGIYWTAYESRADGGYACFGLEIYVPEDGVYMPSLTYLARNSAPIVDVYFVKEGTASGNYTTENIQFAASGNDYSSTYNYILNLDESYKLKSIDMWGDTTAYTEEVTENFGNTELTLDGNSKYYLLFRTVGKNEEFVASGSKALLEVYLKSFKLTPKVEEPVDEMTGFSVSASATKIMAGESANLTATAMWSLSGNKTMTEGVAYKSSDDNIATVSAEGVVTGVSKGTVTITASVSGTEFSDTVEITVKEVERATTEYIYNFKNEVLGSTSNVQRKTLAAMTFDSVNSKLSAPWKVAGTRYVYNTYADSNGLMWNAFDSRIESQVSGYAVELKVVESGTYIPKLNYIAKTSAPITDIYLVENDGTVPALEFGESGNGSASLISFMKSLGEKNKLGTVDMHSEKTETREVSFGEVYLDSDNTYYLMFHAVGANADFAPLVSGTRQYYNVTIADFSIKPPAGDFDKIELAVHGLLDANDPMPNMTEKQIEYTLYDDIGIEIDDIDEDELKIVYSSSNESVATVSANGLVTAIGNGQTKITADVEYKGISRTAEYNLFVAPSGRNMMAHLNPDFEGDEWVWDSERNDTAPEEPVIFHTGIVAEPKDGDEDNRALAFTFNPEVPLPASISAIFLQRNKNRVVLEPGKLYQLTLKVKTDIKKPEDGEYPTIRYNVYAYNSEGGTSSSALAYVSGGNTDLNNFENWNETFSEWQEIALPLCIDSDWDADMLYVSPRLNIRFPELSVGKTGYSGTIWMDDFELREVGYAGLEMELASEAGAGEQNFTVLSKPYTTLGHYISLDSGCLTDGFEISASDVNIVSGFQDSTTVAIPYNTNIASTVAECGGKNGSVTIRGALTLEGITRENEITVAISGHAMKLLYAELDTEENIIDAGSATVAIPTGFMSDGSVADMSSGKIIYESLTPEIISVDENGNIKGLRAGVGKFATTLFLNNSSAYAEGEIIVSDISPIVSAELICPATVGYLRDEPLVLSGKTENGFDADFTNADIRWIIESDPEDGVSIDETNMIFGEIKGAKASVSAEITLNGATVTTNVVEIEVVETDMRDFILDFGKINEKKLENIAIEKYGWEIDWNLSHSSVKNSHMYNKYLYITTNSNNRDFVVDFSVPYTGNYTPMLVRGLTNGYGAEYVAVYIDGKYAGDISFCGDNLRGTKAITNLRSVYLEKGVHQFVLHPYAAKEASRNYYMYPAYVRFAAIEKLPIISEIATAKDSVIIEIEGTEDISPKLRSDDGFVYNNQSCFNGEADSEIKITYESSDSSVASVSVDGIITAAGIGETTIIVTASLNGDVKMKEIPVKVVEKGSSTEDRQLSEIEIDAPFFVMNPETEGVQLEVIGKAIDGAKIDISNAQITWSSENPEVAVISETGYVTPSSIGSAKIFAKVVGDGFELEVEAYISVREGKVGRTFYTDEMVDAARENITKYSWAKSNAKSVIASADRYLGLENQLWEMVPGEGIPRASTVGFRNDEKRYTCRYCGENLLQVYGSYAWISKPLVEPWKIQCPACKRKFPSNDFAKFYELGRDEHGIFNRELALKRHEEEFGGTYGTGYLKNVLYPEIGTEACNIKLTGNETPEKWGVDDGFGYDTGRVDASGTKEIHTYIAYYNHYGLWKESGSNNPAVITTALSTLSKAYMYTGDEKYGRVGAILLDRVADVYPGYDLRPYLLDYSNSDGGAKRGKIVGSIWECGPASVFAESYDALFPMYDDPYVISFLADKAMAYNNIEKNDKTTPEKIRENVETGILREIYREVQRCSISGNFGAHQSTLASAAIVLDNHPETDEMFKWLFKYSESDSKSYNTGGEISKKLVNDVSRDGQGSESAPGYNRIWVTQTTEIASVLARYDESESANLYEHPKFIAMIKSYAPLTLIRRGLAPIGDSGAVGKMSLLPDDDSVMINAFKETGDIEIAQHLYLLKGGNFDGLHYDIWTRNPESLKSDVEKIIEQYGEYDYDKSSLLSGYGFVALRDGTLHNANASTGIKDTERDFWIYFGGAQSHSHKDKLNLGIDAYGLPLTSDLGYPETAGKDPNRNQWQNITLSHNTVVVNEKSQDTGAYSATPLHFDQKDTRVKVVDLDASVVYATTDEYRRTIVMVDYDDEISYGVDFFKILGGNDHLYSFHAFTDKDPEVSENLMLKEQATGSYAGIAVPYGEDPWSVSGNTDVALKYPDGYTWLDDIKRADNPGTGEFYVDWEIEDTWKQSRNKKQDIHLRMTMVNDWNADEVTLANGMPPRKANTHSAIEHLEFMLVRRKGRDLNTLFTTVVEPYDGSRYIKSIENVPVSVASGVPGKTDVAKAVKVELRDGRIDYIVYAQNNSVTYNVGDIFTFCGFVGVWTTDKDGKNIYSYVNDGEMIGNEESKLENLDAAIKGKILGFQDELSFDNWIDAEFDCEVTKEKAEELSGRIVNVERDAFGNSTYVIESVEMTDATHGRIKLGNVTLISGFVNAKQEELGYNYDVAIGKTFNIPLSYEVNPAPVFDEVSDNLSTSAGSSISVRVNATAEDEAELTYRARTIPRGAAFNAEEGILTWKPDSSQIGDNLIAIDAIDEYGRISTKYFTVKVYGSTGGGGGSSASSASGTSTPTIPATKPEDKKDEKDNTSSSTDNVGDGVLDVPQTPGTDNSDANIRFVDLGNHAWAADAINALADEGIIKGTSENTFSPAANITRADFAILLVRAFKLASESEENFADVSASDYFAKELAIARNTGLVNGIGENKFAPRNNITRQDMMVIVYRALNSMEKFVGAIHESPANPDFNEVADYAKEAVSALVNAKLVNGKNGLIDPTAYTTRAEVAVLIQRILDFVK